MPFTPFHFGPGLAIGLPLRRYLHVPTFLAASVLVDIEPLLVLILGLNYPLHGYLHTFLFGISAGIVFGCVMFLFEGNLRPLYKAFLLETECSPSRVSFLASGALGTGLHILLDTPLYSDIKPFFPVVTNPFYHPSIASEVYSLCVWMRIIGVAFYLGLIGLSLYKGSSGKGVS